MAGFFNILGIWIAIFLTFSIYSFLYKDNPFYKVAEQIFVGLSAGYWFIYTIYNILIPNLYTKLATDFRGNALLLIPAVLGVFMILRLIPKLAWLSRFPLALLIGTTAGIGLVRIISSDIINQLNATILNPFAAKTVLEGIGVALLIIGTATGLMYFYFSKKQEGVLKYTSRVGIYFLMISFGAAFGYTAMARISLLIGRLQFILGDWLHIIK